MVGNSAEEGLMLQIHNPSHLDRGRVAVPAGLLSAAVGFAAIRIVTPDSWFWASLLLAFAIGSTVGVLIYRRLGARQARISEQRMREARDDRIARKDRQLKEFQRRNR